MTNNFDIFAKNTIVMISILAFVLVCFGCLNWLSIGLFQYDIVAGLFGYQGSIFSRLVYIVVGVCCIYLIYVVIKNKGRISARKLKKEEQPMVDKIKKKDTETIEKDENIKQEMLEKEKEIEKLKREAEIEKQLENKNTIQENKNN